MFLVDALEHRTLLCVDAIGVLHQLLARIDEGLAYGGDLGIGA